MNPARIEVVDDADALAATVAGELLSRLAASQAEGRTPQLALTGGSIADRLHRTLARMSADADVDWARVGIWWGDERFVEASSEDRNARQAREALIGQVGVTGEHVHEMPAADEGTSLEDAAAAYDRLLGEQLAEGFDVVMLGVGADGHVASLFPGRPELDVADRHAVPVTDSPKPPPERISLTLPALNRARAVWFLVSGEEKAQAVARALADGASVEETPAAGVRGQAETVWFLDRDAASQV
jgi:6-phosphogluconolactonase